MREFVSVRGAVHAPEARARRWRLDKLKSRDSIGAVVALGMAVESAEVPTPTVGLLGWF